MTVEDAAEAVVWWLCRFPEVQIMPEAFGKELSPLHFRIGIVQVVPQTKQRVFELLPLEVADCYEVKEVDRE